MADAQVPVGSILAYAVDDTGSLLKQNWALCNGTGLDKGVFPELFNVIGYSNGGSGEKFNLPDLRGRFLRGKLLLLLFAK